MHEKMSGKLILEIKTSENTASEMIEKAKKLASMRLRRVSEDYENKMAELEARFKQDKRNTIEKAINDASEQKEQRKKKMKDNVRFLERRVKEKREKALVLIMERIMG